jgi:hypothetical protein
MSMRQAHRDVDADKLTAEGRALTTFDACRREE